jgi:hypothetical protein
MPRDIATSEFSMRAFLAGSTKVTRLKGGGQETMRCRSVMVHPIASHPFYVRKSLGTSLKARIMEALPARQEGGGAWPNLQRWAKHWQVMEAKSHGRI